MEFHEKLAKINELEQQGIFLQDFEDVAEYKGYLEENDLRAANPQEVKKLKEEYPLTPILIYYNGAFIGFDGYKDFDSVLSNIENLLHSSIYAKGIEVPDIKTAILNDIRFLVYKTPTEIEPETKHEYEVSSSLVGDYSEYLEAAINAEDDTELPEFIARTYTTEKQGFGGVKDNHPEFIRFLILAKQSVANAMDYTPDAWVVPITMVSTSHIEV